MKAISIRKDNPTIDYDAIAAFAGCAVYFTVCDGRVFLRSSPYDGLIANICSAEEWKSAAAQLGRPFTTLPAMLEPCEVKVIGDCIVFHTQPEPLDIPCLSSNTQVQDA